MSRSLQRRETGYLPGVDALRVIAIGAVLFHHWCYPYLQYLPVRLNPGRLGVNLFFVISGFLITGILLRAISQSDGTAISKSQILRAFYARRFLRIFPLYYGCICIAIVLTVPAVTNLWLWHVTYTTNVHNCIFGTPYPATHFWTLAVEEQFYLLWPVLILRTSARTIGPFLIGSIMLRPVTAVILTDGGVGNLLDASPLGAIHMLGGGGLLAWCLQQDMIRGRWRV